MSRKTEYDILRTISTALVVCYHFIISSKAWMIWPKYTSIGMGQLGVCLFFALSGTTLCLSNPINKGVSAKRFYRRRISSIFPMYYIAWLFFAMFFLMKNRTVNEGIPVRNILFTILGMDGYLLYRYPSFYYMGEWFMGCIILLYLIFPLLHTAIRKKPIISAIAIIIVYAVTNKYYALEMVKDHFFLMNLPIFCFGMYWAGYIHNFKSAIRNVFCSICCVFFALALFYGQKLHIPNNLFLIGTTGYIALFYLSQVLSKCNVCVRLCKIVSKYSFPIFLVHHVVQQQLDTHFAGTYITQWEFFLIFIIYILITGILAHMLYKVNYCVTMFLKNLFQREIDG